MTIIPFDDRDGFIWMDGVLMPWREAKIHVLTHGLHYASSVFEGERAYNDVIFRSADHSKRLIRSADILGMKVPYSVSDLDQIKMEVLRANGLTDAYIRPLAWRGSEELAVGAPNTKTHVMIACWAWPAYYGSDETGIKLCSTNWRKPDPRTAPVESKTACLYSVGTMAKHEATAKGYHDVLMLDTNGNVAEATAANVFAMIDGVLKTPKPDCFLNGLTRQTVLDLAKTLNIPTDVCVITPADMKRATEVFMTGTAAEVVAVGQIDDHMYKVGDVTRKIRQVYADLVRSGNTYTSAAA